MRRLILPLFLLLAAMPAAAQRPEPEWRQAREEQVLVRLNAFQPGVIRLEAGRPTRLVFYNETRTPLTFDAGGFFARSYVRSGDRDMVRSGLITLRPSETRAVTLVPTEGRYRIRSRSWLRRIIGMSALIIVEGPGQRSEGRSID